MSDNLADTARTLREYEAWREKVTMHPDTSPEAYVRYLRLSAFEEALIASDSSPGKPIVFEIDGIRFTLNAVP